MANRKFTLAAQVAALTTLAALLDAGFSLRASVAYLGVSQPQFQARWRQLETQLTAGGDFATGLADLGFHDAIVTQTTLATAHGQLALALRQAGELIDLQTRRVGRLRQLLVYPLLLLGLLAGLQVLVIGWVLPTFTAQQRQVPLTLVVTGGVVLGGAVVGWWLHHLNALRRFAILSRVPGIGPLVVLDQQFQFVSGAAQFLAGGQTLTQYCEHLAQLPPGVLAQAGRRIVARVAAGAALPDALAERVVFPPVVALLRLGQPEALVQQGVALFAQQLLATLEARANRLLALVQPLLFGVIGIQIVLVYRELLVPLYSQFGGGF
ncbi:type II secretion system F family protein [Lacticaseibacillus nasuensis]|uniref:Type II secretory pathway competence component n=1 Tax=Lacticaseibacillus nasuensis JCM 17158 TaxID=1291734 RepID=A0A0R1JS59_9LACO|nr:type II secretion system F family protein [Lacticaseibacillus nasuensis]KRK74197.1 Type II secretory pathway competence component [Lacticaseibacillus nasuensis JCM 17158]